MLWVKVRKPWGKERDPRGTSGDRRETGVERVGERGPLKESKVGVTWQGRAEGKPKTSGEIVGRGALCGSQGGGRHQG